jgi:hypothetical protein
MEEQKTSPSQLEQEIGKAVGDECLRIIIVKHKRLFSVLAVCFIILYAIMTCLGKGVEYLFTDDKVRENVYRLLDAFVNKTVSQLTRENYLCSR